jgi:SAM-dependent methyltransferase
MTAFDTFPWPSPPGTPVPPRWNGQGFEIAGQISRVLAYSTETSHWSDDLTSLHENEAGPNHPIDRASRRLAVASMRQLPSGAPVILDVGCSSGFVLEDLQAALPQARLIGADYLRGPLEGLARRMPEVPILQFDLRHCPLPNACVDGVTSLNVLEHIDDHVSALGEIHRILKPGGLAHIEVPAGPELFDVYDEHLMHHRRYRLSELVHLARQQGFAIRKATHLGYLIYPAFVHVKKRNRKLFSLPAQGKARLVARQIRQTRRTPLLSLLMTAETLLGRVLSYPCGIRCVVLLQKN